MSTPGSARGGLGPLDEYPLHQVPQPIGWPGPSDRHFYDRCYFNAHDRTGDIFVISGMGYYPNLRTKDAFFLVTRGDQQTAVHLGGEIDDDRLNQRVGGYRLEVVEPLRKIRMVLEETEGLAADLTWEGSFEVVQEQRHVMRQGTRVTLDAQRFAQVGTWSGSLSVDGEEIAVSPDTWVGTRDRSWGIRPVGEAEPAGRPADFDGMWWLYVPMRFEDYAIVVIMQEDGDGIRTLNDCTRVWKDGRVEQLGWPQVTIHYTPGGRMPTGASIECQTRQGPLRLEVFDDDKLERLRERQIDTVRYVDGLFEQLFELRVLSCDSLDRAIAASATGPPCLGYRRPPLPRLDGSFPSHGE